MKNEKIYEELALSNQLKEIPTGYSIGVYHTDRGDRYIDIRMSNRAAAYLYFRLFDAATIKDATKCARLSMYPSDKGFCPKQIFFNDTAKENWILDQDEITNLCYALSTYHPDIDYPKFIYKEDPNPRDVLYWILQKCHNNLAERFPKQLKKLRIDLEYLDIPNYHYLIPSNRPKKLRISWIDVCGTICTDDIQALKARYNCSDKLGDVPEFMDDIGRFVVNGKTLYVSVQENKVEPHFVISDYDLFLAATTVIKVSMIHPRYLEPTDLARKPKVPQRLSPEELLAFNEYIHDDKHWKYAIKKFNTSEYLRIPEDAVPPDYTNMEEPLVL